MVKRIPHIPKKLRSSLQQLTQKKFREREHKFLIEGPHLVEEALNAAWEIEAVVVTSGAGANRKLHNLLDRIRDSNIALFEASAREFDILSDTVNSQGIVGSAMMRDLDPTRLWRNARDRAIIVGLNNAADPGNVGTIIRTCGWFGATALLLDRGSVDIYNPKIVRAAMGALFYLDIYPNLNLIDEMLEAKKNDFTLCITAVQGAVRLAGYTFPPKTFVVFGNEAHGVDQSLRDRADISITIPKFGNGESLNVAVSCGIVLHAAVASLNN